MLDALLSQKLHDGTESGLDVLLRPDSLMSRFFAHYLVSCEVEGKSPETLKIYSTVLTGLHRSLDSRFPTADDVRSYLLAVQKRGCKPATVHVHYRTLKTFFNWLVAEGHAKESPMRHIKPPKVPNVVIHPFSNDDLNRLLLVTSGRHFIDFRNRAVILLFLDTGMHLAELAGIQLGDVDIKNGLLNVFGKGSKERVVRMGKRTRKAILDYMTMRKDDHQCLWVTEERTPMAKRGIQMVIVRLCKLAKITDVVPGPHTFRHTAAMMYLLNGGYPFTLQTMLGHSTPEMTRRYTESLKQEHMVRVHEKASPVDNLGTI